MLRNLKAELIRKGYNRPHTVSELIGDRAVINYGDVVIAAVKVHDLTLV